MNRSTTFRLTLATLALLVLGGIVLTWNLARTPAPTGTVDTATTPAAESTPATGPTTTESPLTPATTAPTTVRTAPITSAPTTDAEKVAVEAARVLTTWEPAKDLDETASAARAKMFMTPELAEKIVVSDRGTSTPEWLRAVEKGWTSVPTLTVLPVHDTEVIAVRARWDWKAPDGTLTRSETIRDYQFVMTDGPAPKIHNYTWADRP